MNKRFENILQDLFLSVVNGNTERAEKLIRQIPQPVVEKLAYGGDAAFKLALRFLPEGTSKEIKKNIEEKEKEKTR